jgi:Rrf2 family iron-sulfur cluster assembly transcriptional regulator
MVYIAAHGAERPVGAKEIAAKTGVPAQYLSRILRDAVRYGLLESARGVGGGFRLARPVERIRLLDVLVPFEATLAESRCPFGQPRCSDDRPCGFHSAWKPVATAMRQMLEQTTLAEVGPDGLRRWRRRGR